MLEISLALWSIFDSLLDPRQNISAPLVYLEKKKMLCWFLWRQWTVKWRVVMCMFTSNENKWCFSFFQARLVKDFFFNQRDKLSGGNIPAQSFLPSEKEDSGFDSVNSSINISICSYLLELLLIIACCVVFETCYYATKSPIDYPAQQKAFSFPKRHSSEKIDSCLFYLNVHMLPEPQLTSKFLIIN